MKKTLCGILIGLLAISCLTACNGDGIGAEGISKEEYEQIRPGMTITDVNEIVGGNGERISEKDEKDTIGIIEYIYKYQGENTGYALITFTSDYNLDLYINRYYGMILEIKEKLQSVEDLKTLNEIRTEYLSKKGPISELSSLMKEIPNEEKKEFGSLLNDLKTFVNNSFDELKEKLEEEALNKKLEEEKIDITLSGTSIPSGSPSIIEKIVEETEEFFIGMGYDVLEGPEIELDKYNFEMLNLPKDHPARDAQDTYYLEGENILLRSQTSPVQVRTMLKGEGKTPIRMICPGKTYRREDINATHEQEFTQIEGLVIDKNISLSDLKGTFDAFIKNMFGEGVEARFRPSYYPFTEPSVEMDMSCIYCDGSGCSMCKPKGWITICGGGMVHPNVLKACGYDPNEWQGFAFGMAAERISMLKYGITDMRVCHENDLRETRNFDRKEIR